MAKINEIILVKRSGIIKAKGEIIGIGNHWYKDQGSGVCYLIGRDGEGTLHVEETRQSRTSTKDKERARKAKSVERLRGGKPIRIDIKCVDCGETRNIASQDIFQVKRCADCQVEYRKIRRREISRDRKTTLPEDARP